MKNPDYRKWRCIATCGIWIAAAAALIFGRLSDNVGMTVMGCAISATIVMWHDDSDL